MEEWLTGTDRSDEEPDEDHKLDEGKCSEFGGFFLKVQDGGYQEVVDDRGDCLARFVSLSFDLGGN